MKLETFSAGPIEQFRRRTADIAEPSDSTPNGWSKSLVDPAQIVEMFPTLHVRPDFVLRAYQFREGGNGNGFVWALPIDAEFPDPDDCPRLAGQFLEPPRPPAALDDVMDAIGGDGSALSYLSASILMRELAEFGAMWHGAEWSEHTVLDCDPRELLAGRDDEFLRCQPTGPADAWTWEERLPRTWKPAVRDYGDRVCVTFVTFTALGQEAVTKYTDTFAPGSYTFRTRRSALGRGPAGIVF